MLNRSKILLYLVLGVVFYFLSFSLLNSLAHHYYSDEKVNLNIVFQADEDNKITLSTNKKEEAQVISFTGNSGYQTINFAVENDDFNTLTINLDKVNENKLFRIKKIEFQKFSNLFSIRSDQIQEYFTACMPTVLVGNTSLDDGEITSCIESNQDLISGFQFVNSSKFIGFPYIQLISLFLTLCFVLSLFLNSKVSVFDLDKIFIAIFCGLLILPSIDEMVSLDTTILSEQREYAPNPSFEIENIASYPTAYTDYYNDHFGFRKWLLENGSKFKYKLFSESPSDKVINGRDNWWFYNNEVLPNGEEYIFSDYTHRNLLEEEELQEVKINLEKRKKFVESMGADYYITYFPNKHTIYRDYLPYRAKLATIGSVSRMDQITNYHKETNSRVQFIDTKTTLLENKGNQLLYLKNDTHWNEYGAFIAYKKIFETISEKYSELKPKTNYDIKWIADQDQYDEEMEEWCQGCFTYFQVLSIPYMYARSGLYRMMGIGGSEDVNILEEVPVFKYQEQVKYTVTQKGKGKKIEHYLVYENPFATSNKTLLVFRDSYTRAIAKFYIPHFRKVIFVWNKFKIDVVKKERPDIVLDSHVERYIYDRIK